MEPPVFLRPLVDTLFPPRCSRCGAAVTEQGGLCAECWEGLVIPGEPACRLCQRPLDDLAGMAELGDDLADMTDVLPGLVCAPCMAEPPRHAGLHAASFYNAVSRDIVIALKHGGRLPLATVAARLIAARMPPLEGEWLMVPVPLHRWRLWRRGFNQSALIAAALGRMLGQPLVVDALVRTRQTPLLRGLPRNERERWMKGAIAVRPRLRERLRGSQVMLVDDVVTSGATSAACLRALHGAGVKTVRIACFARVLDEALPAAQRNARRASTLQDEREEA